MSEENPFRCSDLRHHTSTSRRLYGKSCFRPEKNGDVKGQCTKCFRRTEKDKVFKTSLCKRVDLFVLWVMNTIVLVASRTKKSGT